ncbi:MAG TPA: adenylate/guanylate cyclase domain-containing protein [Planctomycetaceae bacterium]|nr:adenylate/guanylate cyclase domain-containing protein [Planctomycetaceae bacterium]
MPDLIAQGPRPQDRWRRALPQVGEETVLGRTARPWDIGWDDRISRAHANMTWDGTKLHVNRLPQARNAIFYQGKQEDSFAAEVGEHFVIGQTTFTLLDQQVSFSGSNSPEDVPAFAEQTFSAHLLRQNKYKDADRRIEALGKLPDIIASAADDQDLCSQVVNLLLQGVPQASYVAILKLKSAAEASDSSPATGLTVADEETQQDAAGLKTSPDLEILHWDCRGLNRGDLRPSSQLIKTANKTQESVLHVWSRTVDVNPSFTQSENVDWAFCTPVVSESCPGWAIYVAGNFAGPIGPQDKNGEFLQDDLKFTELTATTLGALRQVRALQRRQDGLRNFFAPVVMDALAGRDPEQVLAPRETDVSVLFCDLRGFSQQSEDAADRLLELLQRVSDALGVMTHHILCGGGVVGDFHGDAAMGFWGWPISTSNSIQHACQAALAIRAEFEAFSNQPDHPLADFRAGLGVASGSAVAGRIGTTDQVKVTVFGPVVNLASRLEGMTKQLQASILVDEPTADWIRSNVSRDVLRVRRVAKVLPFGMHTPLVVSELLPPSGPSSILSNEHVDAYETALDHFLAGQWHEAFRFLHQVPAEDQVKDFLTVYIAQHRRIAPPDWQGVIELPGK